MEPTDNKNAMDYVVEGTGIGDDVLAKVKRIRESQDEGIIYGVYNNADKGIFVKINDFFIDRSKITLKDKSYFFHMLAVMVEGGIPVVAALKSLAGRTENLRFQRILNTIAYNCERGSDFASAMSRFEGVFDEAEIGIIKSGEATGRLGAMLFRLSNELDRRYDLSLKLWGAAVYPMAVLAVLILVAVGMLVWVFPTLLNLLKEGGISETKLPFATRILITVQSALVNYWWLILIVLFGLYGMFYFYIKSDYGAVRWDYFKLKIPVVGKLLRKVYVLKFVTFFGLLVESGLDVIRSLKISSGALANRVYKLKIQEVINSVKNGGKISQSLRDSEFLFPPEVAQMLSVGESSASLSKVSEKIADQYQLEVDNTLKKVSAVLEPVMILFVGLMVAILALSIMAPIFNLTSIAG